MTTTLLAIATTCIKEGKKRQIVLKLLVNKSCTVIHELIYMLLLHFMLCCLGIILNHTEFQSSLLHLGGPKFKLCYLKLVWPNVALCVQSNAPLPPFFLHNFCLLDLTALGLAAGTSTIVTSCLGLWFHNSIWLVNCVFSTRHGVVGKVNFVFLLFQTQSTMQDCLQPCFMSFSLFEWDEAHIWGFEFASIWKETTRIYCKQ
jgi:hypothetical protein